MDLKDICEKLSVKFFKAKEWTLFLFLSKYEIIYDMPLQIDANVVRKARF